MVVVYVILQIVRKALIWTIFQHNSSRSYIITYIGYDYEVTWDGNFKRFSCLSLYNTDTYQDRKLKYESFTVVLGMKQTELMVLIYKSIGIIWTSSFLSFLFISMLVLNFDCWSLEDIIRLHYDLCSTTLLYYVQVKDIMYQLYKATKSSLRSITPKEIKLLKHLLNIIDPEERFSALATAFSPGDEHEAKDPYAQYTWENFLLVHSKLLSYCCDKYDILL